MKRRIRLAWSVSSRVVGIICTVVAIAGTVVFAWIGYGGDKHAAVTIDAYRAAVIVALVGIVVFVSAYTKLAPWWKNAIGRTIVAKDLALFLALVPVALSLFFQLSRETSRVASSVDLASIGAIGFLMIWRTIVWIRVQKEQRHGSLPAGPDEVEEGKG